jgi:hypothetical protein
MWPQCSCCSLEHTDNGWFVCRQYLLYEGCKSSFFIVWAQGAGAAVAIFQVP